MSLQFCVPLHFNTQHGFHHTTTCYQTAIITDVHEMFSLRPRKEQMFEFFKLSKTEKLNFQD